LRIDHESFRRDFDWLLEVIRKALSESQPESLDTRLDDTELRSPSEPSEPVVQPAQPPEKEWTAKVVERTRGQLVIEIQLTHTTYRLRDDGKKIFIMHPSLRATVKSTMLGNIIFLQDGPNQVRADYTESFFGAIRGGILDTPLRHGKLSLNGRVVCRW
jgi:hypothetical protein